MSLFCTLALNKQVSNSLSKAESALKPNFFQFTSKPQAPNPSPKLTLFQSHLLDLSQEMHSPVLFNH